MIVGGGYCSVPVFFNEQLWHFYGTIVSVFSCKVLVLIWLVSQVFLSDNWIRQSDSILKVSISPVLCLCFTIVFWLLYSNYTYQLYLYILFSQAYQICTKPTNIINHLASICLHQASDLPIYFLKITSQMTGFSFVDKASSDEATEVSSVLPSLNAMNCFYLKTTVDLSLRVFEPS